MKCKQCNQVKTERDFHKMSKSATGFYPYCKECRRERGGYAKRKPRTMRETTPTQNFEDLIEDVNYLVETFAYEGRYKKAQEELKTNPQGPFSEDTMDVLFGCWNTRQQYAGNLDIYDETYPVMTESAKWTTQKREITGYRDEDGNLLA